MVDFDSLRDLLDSQHLSLWCRFYSWIVHHSVELPEPESEASLLFAVGLIRMSTCRQPSSRRTRPATSALSSERLAETSTFSSPSMLPQTCPRPGPCLGHLSWSLPAVGYALMSFITLSWSLRHDFARRRCLRVRHSRSASAELTPPVHWPLARPRADPRALLRTRSHVLRVSGALLATVSLAWSWIPPCRVWSTFVRRRECLVAGASASKVCIANGDLHLSSGFALLCFPRSYTRLLWFVAFCFGPRAAVPPKPVFATLRSCRRCAWLCASWSAGTSRRRHACID